MILSDTLIYFILFLATRTASDESVIRSRI